MRKDIKKRLEKALITLEEPGGSTIQSIVEMINKDSPVLSVRRVLEALQDGINEGFLCMYNGRIKLRQQVQREEENWDRNEHKKDNYKHRAGGGKTKSPVSDIGDDDSDFLSDEDDEDDEVESKPQTPVAAKKNMCRRLPSFQTLKKCHKHRSKKPYSRRSKQSRRMSKKENMKRKRQEARKMLRHGREPGKSEQSVLEMESNEPEKSGRPTAERADLKKQRGPRCTSMKKDVRMPSKVHIPFAPTSIPPRSNTFNDLLRRSPKPVNGPPFDGIAMNLDNSGFFGTYL